MKSLIILGGGGYAQEVLWIVDDLNSLAPTWDFIGFVDPLRPQMRGKQLYDRPILGGYGDVPPAAGQVYFSCGIGHPDSRRKECLDAERRGWIPATLIHPRVICARHVIIGPGSVVGAGSILAPYAHVGRHCAINLHVSVGHNSVLGDYSVLSPGVRISGGAILEERVFIGTNATVYLKRRVGAGASLGANSFLMTNLAPGKSALGIPAVPLAKSTGAGICTSQESHSK